ncbi:MAG TPA: hypothetical protein VFQ35_21065, partial [Polyangiaceae bacterium]|nr:hypothetical protein [Polyangiaceae bacterium]
PAVALGFWAFTSCDETRHTTTEAPQTTEPSPNASIMPAPLASEIEPEPKASVSHDAGAPTDAGSDAGVISTRFLREDSAVDPDLTPRENTGVRATMRLRWLDLPPFPRLPEANLEALQRQREALAFELVVELSVGGRMRVRVNSDAFVWPRGTELRARLDRVGNVLAWSAGTAYSVLPVGTLRAALNEGRPDSVPLSKPKLVTDGGGNVLGAATERIELSTPLGRLLLEQALLSNAGASGKLLCRALSELVAAEPLNAACERAYVPLRAELISRAGGHLLIETIRLERDHVTLDPALLQTPPAAAAFRPLEIPSATPAQIPSSERLRELRLRALPRSEKPDPAAPKDGLVIQNRGDVLRYLLLDGLPVARVAARSELKLEGLLPGKYALATLDFLGDDPASLRIVELPARVALGEEP